MNKIFEKAKNTPIKINKDNKSYILMNEKEYLDLNDELLSLRKNLKSLLNIVEGKSKTYTSAEECVNELFKELNKK